MRCPGTGTSSKGSSRFGWVPRSDPPLILARLLLYVGATLTIGHVALQLCGAFAAADRSPGRPRIEVRLAEVRLAWWALWSAGALLLVLQARAMEIGLDVPALQSLLTETTWGRGWTLLLISVAVANVAYALRAPPLVQALAVGAIAVAMGGLGHAAADDEWPLASRLFDALHVLGVGCWLGGLYFVWRYAPHEHQADAWGIFSRMATVAAPIVLLTGFGSAVRRLAGLSVGTVFGSLYGRLLLAKIVVAFVVLGFGAVHRQRTLESRRPSAGSVRTELLFVALVLVLTSVLTGTSPE